MIVEYLRGMPDRGRFFNGCFGIEIPLSLEKQYGEVAYET